jgi:hypothetical protein
MKDAFVWGFCSVLGKAAATAVVGVVFLKFVDRALETKVAK